MDGTPGTFGNGVGSSRRGRLAEEEALERKRNDIFVRAHTSVRTKTASDRRWSPKWPKHCLIFDTETTLDPAQRLNLGVFRRCKLVGSRYMCVEEGIFHRDDATNAQIHVMQGHQSNPPTLPEIEHFPAKTQLSLQNRMSFVRSVFWKSIRKGELIVGFNLPFDLSRLAVKWPEGEKGDWSLALSHLWKNPKTGRVVPNPKRPRIVVDAQNSKMAFIKLGSILHKKNGRKKVVFSTFARWAGPCATFRTTLKVPAKLFTSKASLITNRQGGSPHKKLSTAVVMSRHHNAC